MTNWDHHKETVYQIAAEEITLRGVNGYLVRTTRRLQEDEGLDVSKDALDSFLRRHSTEWATIREQAKGAKADGDIVQVSVEQVEALPEDHPTVRDLERRLQVAKADVRRERKKRREADEKAAITQEVVSTLETLVDPWEPAQADPVRQEGEWEVDGVLILSDEHADRVVDPETVMALEDFDFNIFRARAQRAMEIIQGFSADYLPKFKFNRLWVLSLGDKVNGDIHNMAHRNHFQNSLKAALATADVEAEMFRQLIPYFPGGVHVIGVSGNHGRRTKKKDPDSPHDNLDYIVNAAIAMRIQGEIDAGRFSMHLPRSWVGFAEVRGWRFVLNHGDNVRGYNGIPWYGFDRREGKVKALLDQAQPWGDPGQADFFAYGHYHTPMERPHASTTAFHNGAFYFTDPFAAHQVSAGNNPEQRFLVLKDREEDRGPILNVPIYLRDRHRESALRAGEWEPDLGRETILDEVAR